MKRARTILVVAVLAMLAAACSDGARGPEPIPADIQAIIDKPEYASASWGLHVVDLASGRTIYDLDAERMFLIGSVRKLFSVGVLLDQVGADHRYDTPLYVQGTIDGGVLDGDLILVASGDLTMGGRTNPDGTIAITDLDHNEADALGQAVLTAPDPLAGYDEIARQIAAAGITTITGDVVIDDRLFVPFFFRGQFFVRPIFVNDDVVDLSLLPTSPGAPASVVWRPVSQAFTVLPSVVTGDAGSEFGVVLDPEVECIGTPGCSGPVGGLLPLDFAPPLNGTLPLVRTFRITDPASYARTILIEALARAGVTVAAPVVAPNPVAKLPAKDAYDEADRVATLRALPYADDARLVLKISYNIGADTSLVLYGLTQGVDTIEASLAVERETLARRYGIPRDQLEFVDGSGGGLTRATPSAVTQFLDEMTAVDEAAAFRDALPILGVDGSLAALTDFTSDPTLAGARGQVEAKTGTFVEGTDDGPSLRARAMGGYVTTRSGRRLAYLVVVNDVGLLADLDEIFAVSQDVATISAMIWRDG